MAVESRVTQEEIKKEPEKPIDREKVRGRMRWRRTGGAQRGARRRQGSALASCFNPCLSSLPQTCPLLLRVFTTNNGRHHRMDEFSRGNVPSSELQIYTW